MRLRSQLDALSFTIDGMTDRDHVRWCFFSTFLTAKREQLVRRGRYLTLA